MKSPRRGRRGLTQLVHAQAVYKYLSFGNFFKAGQHAQKSGLAASIGPEDAEHATFFQFEINIIENPLPSIGVPNSLRRYCV